MIAASVKMCEMQRIVQCDKRNSTIALIRKAVDAANNNYFATPQRDTKEVSGVYKPFDGPRRVINGCLFIFS